MHVLYLFNYNYNYIIIIVHKINCTIITFVYIPVIIPVDHYSTNRHDVHDDPFECKQNMFIHLAMDTVALLKLKLYVH